MTFKLFLNDNPKERSEFFSPEYSGNDDDEEDELSLEDDSQLSPPGKIHRPITRRSALKTQTQKQKTKIPPAEPKTRTYKTRKSQRSSVSKKKEEETVIPKRELMGNTLEGSDFDAEISSLPPSPRVDFSDDEEDLPSFFMKRAPKKYTIYQFDDDDDDEEENQGSSSEEDLLPSRTQKIDLSLSDDTEDEDEDEDEDGMRMRIISTVVAKAQLLQPLYSMFVMLILFQDFLIEVFFSFFFMDG